MTRASIKRFFEQGVVWLAAGDSTGFYSPDLTPSSRTAASFNVPEIDCELQGNGLPFGCLHEWFFYSPTLLSILSGNAAADAVKKSGTFSGLIVWIGRECWPTPFLLQQTLPQQSLLKQCLFLDIKNAKDKLWCFETALRSPAVAISICRLKDLNFARTRRLALAAKHGSSLGFLIRPEREQRFSSAAATRWQMTPLPFFSPAPTPEPRWHLSLLKQKGKQPATSSWIIEFRQDEKISVHIPADVAGQSGAQEIKQRSA